MGAGEVQPLETPGRCGCLVEMFRRLRHGLATEFLLSVSRFRICTAHSTQELVLRIQSHICGSAEVIPPTPVHLEAKLPRPGPEGTGWRPGVGKPSSVTRQPLHQQVSWMSRFLPFPDWQCPLPEKQEQTCFAVESVLMWFHARGPRIPPHVK
jgi:hypothetical protein